jgi:glycosyltransferase involved in cell wall biosynthesis
VIDTKRIAVVIPCYRVREHVLGVIAAMPAEVDAIYVVDDACPQQSGDLVAAECRDPRVTVLRHAENAGVGGAVMTGYQRSLADNVDIVVKIDGDGQMDPALIPSFVRPLVAGVADYTKGNRFFWLDGLAEMPYLRLFGNAVLSFVAKLATGYWHLMDPTNGYTAIHRTALAALPLHRIDRRYFFESDMLFRLYTIRAVAQDVPMRARYGNETSSLSVRRAALSFPGKYANRFAKRFFYAYILRDFNAGSAAAILGLLLVLAGGSFGAAKWIANAASGVTTTTGTVMLAAIPLLLGGHLLISAFNFDIGNAPTRPLQSPNA